MQFKDEVELASMHEQSEDCLTLNIWKRRDAGTGLPVMVYIHGGAFISGGSADPLYDGANFAAGHDVVIVTLNYRIGLFGSLCLTALPGGEGYVEAGYLNILDQICALEWIKENIDAFGGDPGNITLFGESAGSASAALLAVCPRAKGLFQRAICESGPIDLYKTRGKGEPYAAELAEIMGCSSVADMLGKSAEDLMAGVQELCDRHPFEVSLMFSPVCDGTLLPKKPMKAWKNGAAKDVDIMIGSTEDEFNYFKFYFKPEELPDFWRGQIPFHFDESLDIAVWEKAYEDAYPEEDLIENCIDEHRGRGRHVRDVAGPWQRLPVAGHDAAEWPCDMHARPYPSGASRHAAQDWNALRRQRGRGYSRGELAAVVLAPHSRLARCRSGLRAELRDTEPVLRADDGPDTADAEAILHRASGRLVTDRARARIEARLRLGGRAEGRALSQPCCAMPTRTGRQRAPGGG